MEHNVADIVAHPDKYGFAWTADDVHKNGVNLGKVPLVEHKDHQLMVDTFGASYFVDMANGTSGRVRDQRIGRDARWADRKVTDDAIKTMIVEAMLGKRSRRTGGKVTVYLGMDGNEYRTELECTQSNIAFLVEKGMTPDQAKALLTK